ncbi:MAG: hypothetical protein ACKODX_15525 [Gemmata sp.]
MRSAALLSLLALLAAPARAQEPRPSVEQLVAKLTEVRKQQADLKKLEDATTAELRSELKRLQELVDKLNLPDVRPPGPPEPADPLRAKLRAAFDADADPKKRDHARDLAALYRQAAGLCADAGVGTAGDLLSRVKAAATTLVGADALRECRRVVAGELGALLPTDDALTAEQRKAAAALFAKLATILEGL